MFSGGTNAFDIFNESEAEDFSNFAAADTVRPPRKRKDNSDITNGKGKKRASSPNPVLSKEDADRDMRGLTDPDDEDHFAETRSRVNDPMPTVTDTFEQDLEREVASAAGLMPSAEGANVVLSHQVCRDGASTDHMIHL